MYWKIEVYSKRERQWKGGTGKDFPWVGDGDISVYLPLYLSLPGTVIWCDFPLYSWWPYAFLGMHIDVVVCLSMFWSQYKVKTFTWIGIASFPLCEINVKIELKDLHKWQSRVRRKKIDNRELKACSVMAQ